MATNNYAYDNFLFTYGENYYRQPDEIVEIYDEEDGEYVSKVFKDCTPEEQESVFNSDNCPDAYDDTVETVQAELKNTFGKYFQIPSSDDWLNDRVSQSFGGKVLGNIYIDYLGEELNFKVINRHGYYEGGNIDILFNQDTLDLDPWNQNTTISRFIKKWNSYPAGGSATEQALVWQAAKIKKEINKALKVLRTYCTQMSKSYQFSNGECGYHKI